MEFNEIVTLIADVSLALSFVVALIFGIAQVRAVARDRKDRLTLEALRNFQTRDFAQLLNFVRRTEFPTAEQGLNALPTEQQVMFIEFSQQMESLGILVAENLIDLDLVDKTLGSFVITSWKKYEIIFAPMRKNDPYLGEYFQWLAETIDQRMKERPRKPFYE